jgi:hypothetical protein
MALIETDANDPGYIAWKAAHEAYKAKAEANRPVYRAIRDDAVLLGMTAAGFEAAVRAEVDEDVAAEDSGEWIRAARMVRLPLLPDEPDECADEAAAWERAVWERACNADLDRDEPRW